MCLTKKRSGVSGVAVHVIAPSNTVGSTFAVCATYKSTAITGLTKPFLPEYIHTETIMRLEQAPTIGLTTGGDADPEGERLGVVQGTVRPLRRRDESGAVLDHRR